MIPIFKRSGSRAETKLPHAQAVCPGGCKGGEAACGLKGRGAKRSRAFSLIETLIASVFITSAAVAFYTCIIFGLKQISIAREERRSTQILVEMTETLRLYTWEQMHDSSFLPQSFRVQYDPLNPANPGVTYAGTVGVSNYAGNENYASNMAMVTVSVMWTNDNVPRQRDLTTIVTRLGLQNYVY
jgi:Tfp pilus assembly protein PilV